jgi:hypothetical protein
LSRDGNGNKYEEEADPEMKALLTSVSDHNAALPQGALCWICLDELQQAIPRT